MTLPGTEQQWRSVAGPYLRPAVPASQLTWQVTLATIPALAAGTLLFGLHGAIIVALCGGTALIANQLLGYLSERGGAMSAGHAVMTGTLLGLTLPPNAGWDVPVVGALIAVVMGKWLLGGMGNQLWSPVLAGRVVLQLLYPRVMLKQACPILGPGRLLVGDPTRTAAPDPYFGWQESVLPPDADAWLLPRTDALLSGMRRGVIESVAPDSPDLHIDSLSRLVNDVLPPWRDTVLGMVGGGIGETCLVCILAGGLFLIHRGLVRWQLPVSILVAAAITAAVFPITCGGGIESAPDRVWLPGLIYEGSAPVGLVYVLYHLTAGELVFAAFFVATDMVTSPLRARGQILFGLCIGVLAIVLRMYAVVPGSCYWAILIMNPFVPLIDRLTRSRVNRPDVPLPAREEVVPSVS